MVNGHMTCGVVRDELMVRVGPAHYEKALTRKHAREMDFTGRPLRGLVYVGAVGIKTKQQLKKWVDEGVAFTKTLPKK